MSHKNNVSSPADNTSFPSKSGTGQKAEALERGGILSEVAREVVEAGFMICEPNLGDDTEDYSFIPNLVEWDPSHPLLHLDGEHHEFPGLRAPNTNHPVLNLGRNGRPNQYRSDMPVVERSTRGKLVASMLFASGIAYSMRKNIPPGHLGVSFHNGEPVILGEGNHLLLSPQHKFDDQKHIFKMGNDPVHLGPRLLVVTVPSGELGVAHQLGRYEILRPGRHVLEGAQYVYEGSHSVNQEHLKLTPTTQIVTIPSGKLGVASNAGVYEVLAPGRHVLNGPQYTFHGSESVKLSDVELGPNVRIITVEQGHLGLSENQGQFSILAPGRHALIGTTFSYLGQKKCSQVMELGPVKIVTVARGQLGISFDQGELVLLEPGVNVLQDARHVFTKMVDTSEKFIDLGPKQIITVYEGEVGISYYEGQLKVLQPGRYTIVKQEQRFDGFMNTKQVTHKLEEVLVSTSDNVELLIKSDVICKIENPELVARELGNQEAVDIVVHERAKMVLNDIFRSHSSYEVQSVVSMKEDGKPSISKPKKSDCEIHGKDNKPSLLNAMEGDFMKMFAENVGKVGIRLVNMGIIKFRYANKQLHDQLAQRATISAKAISQLEQARATAKAQLIAAEAEAEKLRIQTEMKNKSDIQNAETKARSKLIEAEADKKAMELEADGKQRLGSVLDQCPGLQQLELTKANGDAFGKALANTKTATFFERSDDKMGWLNLMSARGAQPNSLLPAPV